MISTAAMERVAAVNPLFAASGFLKTFDTHVFAIIARLIIPTLNGIEQTIILMYTDSDI
jgi:hypothetical protein